MRRNPGKRTLSLFLALAMCLSLLPMAAQAVVPTSAGWSITELSEAAFRVYKHAAADSAEAEMPEGRELDLRDPLHFYLDGPGNSYCGFALMRLEGPEDTRTPRPGDTVADADYYELRCSTSSGSGYTYVTPSGVFPDWDNHYDDGTMCVNGGMALQHCAGKNALYYPAPGWYRFVLFHRQSESIFFSGVYHITDVSGLYDGPGSMSAAFARTETGTAVSRLYTDGTYDLRLSGLRSREGAPVSADALTVKTIDLLTYSGSYIRRDGSSADSIVSYPFNEVRTLYDASRSCSDGRSVSVEDGAVMLRGFTAAYRTEWGDGLQLASEDFDYVYRVRLTAELEGETREFWCTAPIAATYHDPSWTLAFDLTYRSNYPEGGEAGDVTDQKLEGIGAVLRPGAVFPSPEGWRFNGWNTAADGSGTDFLPGQVYSEDSPLTLYAQWLHTDYVVILPALDPVVNVVRLRGVYEEGEEEHTEQLWCACCDEAEDLSGAYLEVTVREGRSYTRLELCADIDCRDAVIAVYDGEVDQHTAVSLPLTATDESWSIVTGPEAPGLEENRDYTLDSLTVDGVRAFFPQMLSGNGDYRVRLSGVPGSDAYADYDWSRTRSASVAAGSLLRVTDMEKLEPGVRVTGRVTYRETDVPVPFAAVTATQNYAGMQRTVTASADAEGRYTLRLFQGARAVLTAGDSYFGDVLENPSGEVTQDLTLMSLKLSLTLEPRAAEREGQAALVRRYLTAPTQFGETLLLFPGSDVRGVGLRNGDLTGTSRHSLYGDTLPETLTVRLDSSLFRETEAQTFSLEGGEGAVTFAPELNPGVLVTLGAGLTGLYRMVWYDGAGEYIAASVPFILGPEADCAFVCPAEEKTGTFTLALLSTPVWNTHSGRPLSDIDPENVTRLWEDVELREGEITELEGGTVSAAASMNALYPTKPASTMRADRESFSHEAELVRISGSIGLDKGLEGGMLTRLAYRPVRGNCASFKALIINGETIPYDHVEFEETFFVFNEPIALPCDYTLLVTSERLDLDMDLSLFAWGTYDGGSFGGAPVGTVKVKRPGLALSTPSTHVCSDTVTLTLTAANSQALTLYDNGEAVGPVHSGANLVQLPGTDDELLTVHELYVMDQDGSRGESLRICHWAQGPQLRAFTMDWDYIAYGTHPCISVGDHYSHWSAIGMDNVRFTAVFDNPGSLDDLPGWEDEKGEPVKVVFKVFTSDGVIRFLPAREEEPGVFRGTVTEHLARAVTHAEALYQPVPGPTGVTLEGAEYDVVWEADSGTLAQLESRLAVFREEVELYLADKSAEDSYELRWNGTEAVLTGADPTEAGAEKTMTEAFTDAVAQFEGYGIGLTGCGVAYHSERTLPEWLEEIAGQQADTGGRPGEYSRSLMYDGGEYFALEKAEAARLAREHRQTRLGSVTVDQFVMTDLDPDTPDGEGCLYYLTLTFLADPEHDTYLSLCTASLGGGFAGFPAETASARLFDGYGGHYGRYEETKSSMGAAGGSSAILGTNAAAIDLLNDTSRALQMNKGITNAGGAVLGVVDIWQGLEGWKNRTLDNHTMYRDIEGFMNSPCFQKLTEGQKQLVQHNFEKFRKAYQKTETTDMIVTGTNTAVTACGVAAACSGVGAPASLAITLGGVVVGWIGGAVSNAVRKEFVETYETAYNSISRIIRAHAYQADDDDCKGEDKPDGDGSSFSVCFDPSGVVYEGVLENPVRGAKVTLYYAADEDGNLLKEGEESLIASLRPAGDVEGLDPASPVQITGPDGLYQWFVPEGLWFVTAEYGDLRGTSRLDAAACVSAAGLTLMGEDAGALLPVLPPQLDVNIPLRDEGAPRVEAVGWTGEGILVRFSRYMEEAGVLDPASYTLTGPGDILCPIGEVESVERGRVPANIDPEQPAYTRTVLLHTADPRDDARKLTVSGGVRSCAGTPMGADHTAFGTTEDAAIEGAAFEGASLEAVVTSVTAATVFCAFYDESGRMLSLASLPISAGRSQSLRFAAGDPACFEARVFVLGEEQAPLCAGRRAER